MSQRVEPIRREQYYTGVPCNQTRVEPQDADARQYFTIARTLGVLEGTVQRTVMPSFSGIAAVFDRPCTGRNAPLRLQCARRHRRRSSPNYNSSELYDHGTIEELTVICSTLRYLFRHPGWMSFHPSLSGDRTYANQFLIRPFA